MHHDLYHLPAYVRFAARRQVDGEPLAYVAEERGRRLFIPIIRRRIPSGIHGGDSLYDAISPRGYPGPLATADAGHDLEGFVDRALGWFIEGLRGSDVVTAFIRLHPLLLPSLDALSSRGAVVEEGDSFSIDLSLEAEEQWQQMRANHRRDISRSIRKGYETRIDDTWKRFDAFIDVYRQSMDRLGVDDFWRLSPGYFWEYREKLADHLHLCVVELDGELVAAALLTEVDGIVEYHLAGTAENHMAASPSKLIVDFARRWGKERGNRILHLAGTPRRGDSLSRFKAGFTPLIHPVYSWRIVVNQEAYDLLANARRLGVNERGADAFFPEYRRPDGFREIPRPSSATGR